MKKTSSKPKTDAKKKASGGRSAPPCLPDFTVDGTPVVDLDTKLKYLKSCILDGHFEDAIGHLDDLRDSVHLRHVLRGMKPDNVTGEGHKCLRFTSLADAARCPDRICPVCQCITPWFKDFCESCDYPFSEERMAARAEGGTTGASSGNVALSRSDGQQGHAEAAHPGEHDLLAILSPVLDWYQSDEEDARPPLDILRDIVADLQSDRADALAGAADKRRLDWMESHPFMAYRQRDPGHGRMYDHFTLVDEDFGASRVGIVKSTFRECVDEALRSPADG